MSKADAPGSENGEEKEIREVTTYTEIGGKRVYLNQIVYYIVKEEGSDIEMPHRYTVSEVVVGFSEDGIVVNDTQFDGIPHTVTEEKWENKGYRAAYVDGIPVWGY